MEVNCYCKMVQQMVTPTNYVFVTPTNLLTWAGFTLRRAPGTWEISKHLTANYSIGKDKKILPSKGGAPHIVAYGKFDPGYCITFIKRLYMRV